MPGLKTRPTTSKHEDREEYEGRRRGWGVCSIPVLFLRAKSTTAARSARTRRSRRKPLPRRGARAGSRLRCAPKDRGLRASVSLRSVFVPFVSWREAALRGPVFLFFAATAKASALSPTTTEMEASLPRIHRALRRRHKPAGTFDQLSGIAPRSWLGNRAAARRQNAVQ